VLGRITGETQRLYKITTSSAEPLQIEFEHRIAHRLDALGNRQQSQLQGVGEIEWLLYGSGHVHGLQHEGSALIDFERDRLHRETGRTLQGQDPQGPSGALRVQRRWDALGRLQALASQGLQGQAQVPQVLVGQISQRQYHYDALGQLTAVQTAQDTLRYGYDAAGRLRAMQEGGQQQRWDVDPAGNRLPGLTQAGQAAQANWAAQVHAHWRQQDFNLLGERQASAPGQGPITRWPDNRIGFTEHAAWRYDACGNRVEQLKQDEGRDSELGYDGGHPAHRGRQRGPGHWRGWWPAHIGREHAEHPWQQHQPLHL
jgi:YD repeat-containing protein